MKTTFDKSVFEGLYQVDRDPNASSIGWFNSRIKELYEQVLENGSAKVYCYEKGEELLVSNIDQFRVWVKQSFRNHEAALEVCGLIKKSNPVHRAQLAHHIGDDNISEDDEKQLTLNLVLLLQRIYSEIHEDGYSSVYSEKAQKVIKINSDEVFFEWMAEDFEASEVLYSLAGFGKLGVSERGLPTMHNQVLDNDHFDRDYFSRLEYVDNFPNAVSVKWLCRELKAIYQQMLQSGHLVVFSRHNNLRIGIGSPQNFIDWVNNDFFCREQILQYCELPVRYSGSRNWLIGFQYKFIKNLPYRVMFELGLILIGLGTFTYHYIEYGADAEIFKNKNHAAKEAISENENLKGKGALYLRASLERYKKKNGHYPESLRDLKDKEMIERVFFDGDKLMYVREGNQISVFIGQERSASLFELKIDDFER